MNESEPRIERDQKWVFPLRFNVPVVVPWISHMGFGEKEEKARLNLSDSWGRRRKEVGRNAYEECQLAQGLHPWHPKACGESLTLLSGRERLLSLGSGICQIG